MANKFLLKKVAPIVLSASVVLSGVPTTAMAADIADSDVEMTTEVESEDSSEDSVEFDAEEEAADDSEFEVDAEDESESEIAETEEAAETTDETTEDADLEEEIDVDELAGDTNEDVEYVLMNIPYEQFYRSQLKNNDVAVDAFTSATYNKSKSSGMMNGNAAYHTNSTGDKLAGVTFPVKISDASVLANLTQVTDDSTVTISVNQRGQTLTNTYTGKDALIESADYSYYVLTETPSYYKELTVNADGSYSFGEIQGMGEAKTVSISSTFSTESQYGDYELDLNDEEFAAQLNTSSDNIYGVVVNTSDGATYALRHVENIWRGGHLSWCTGFTTSVHNCPTSSAHYESMMGKTITSVTYYTNKGIIDFDVEDTYVPVKTDVAIKASDVMTTDTAVNVEVTGDLPSDFSASYSVDGTAAEYKDSAVTVSNLTPGSHTLTLSDANGKYASVSTTFTATTETAVATYDEYNLALVKTAEATDDEFYAYIDAISKVKIGEKEYATSGRNAVKVVTSEGTLDFTNAPVAEGDTVTVSATGYPDLTFTYSETVYAYAGLTWSEYWTAEDVYQASNTTSVDSKDEHNDPGDKGGFDTVTRATFNHGPYRASFQAITTVVCEDGNTYGIDYFVSGSSTDAILTDGRTATFAPRNMTVTVDGVTSKISSFQMSGIKYVPVSVKRADFADFAKAYSVTKNGETFSYGSTAEKNVKPAYGITAEVNANTNGLKGVTKNSDGSFSFGARQTGTGSGIKDQALKTADVKYQVKEASGSFGEFLRVDLLGTDEANTTYGDFGGAMQAVEWTYYGNDSTCSNALMTYGTKFAADNWMHSKMGIQLGLTDSIRCQLPEGYDGTGYWSITVYALGYQDYTFTFQATADNIVTSVDASTLDTTALQAAIDSAKAQMEKLTQSAYTTSSWDALETELEESEEMVQKVKDLVNAGVTTTYHQTSLDEQILHIQSALENLEERVFKLNETSGTLYTQGETTTTLSVETTEEGTITWKSSNTKVAVVDESGKVTVKGAGTANITATMGDLSATYKLTVKTPITLNKTSMTLYANGSPVSYTLKSTLTVSGTVKYTSSNTSVATVDSKGVVKAKKAGTTVITATVGNYKATCKVTVKNPSITVKSNRTTIYTKSVTTATLSVSKTGITATPKYTSSNTKVATVNSKGVVTAKKAGTANITVQIGSVKKTVKITVKNPYISVKESKSVIYTKGGKTFTTSNITVSKYAVSGTAKFTSSNNKVATVNSKGVVTAKKAGTVNITVKVGSYKKVVKITVKDVYLKLTKTSATINKGKTTKISMKVSAPGRIKFESSNIKVATVDYNGVVKGVKKGTAYITVYAGSMTAKFKVVVK